MPTTNALRPIYALLGRSEWQSARAQCGDLLLANPEQAAIHHAIGLSFCGEAAFTDALQHFERARALDGENPRWARDAGVLYAKVERWTDAVTVLAPVLRWLDSQALAVYLTAAVESAQARPALTALEAQRDVPLPADTQFLTAYGSALVAAGRHADAEVVLLDCLRQAPETPEAHDALAVLFEDSKRGERALGHWQARARLEPGSAYAQLRLALALSERGQCEAARPKRTEAEMLGFARPQEHSSRLYMMLSDPHETADTILAASLAAFDRRSSFQAIPKSSPRSRRLRVGYVSGECRSTPAYYFFRPFLLNHDRSAVEVFLYNCSALRDHVTPRYMRWPEHWRETAHLTDAQLVARMRADELDIAIDLSGHFPYNRLWALSDRGAPVQATYPNYPATTGCPGMDYFLTDQWTSPPGCEHEYSERLYRLPRGYLAFEPPDDGPEVAPLPCQRNRRPTFGIFQRFGKFNDEVWDAVAGVLTDVPDALLLVQNGDAELDRPESNTARMVFRHLHNRRIDPARIRLRGPLTYLDHLAAISEVDVALDTFPYTGQTTTCESLWMGVPVVTFRRSTHVSRVCGALLARAGHPDWIAESAGEYRQIAAALVSNATALGQIRGRLRADFAACGLPDGPALARDLEAAYHSLV